MKLNRITLSFKNTKADIALYNAICEQEEISIFIKTAVAHYLEYLESIEKIK
jgi:uncharacterized protein involved in tolerance to divalent cations